MTLAEIITTALLKLRVLSAGEAPSGPEAADGVAAFNAMWRAMRGREIGQKLTRQWSALAGDTATAGGLYSVNITTPAEPANGDRLGVTRAVTVTAGSGTIEGQASVTTTAATSWFYREDTDNWVKEADLTATDAHPFSSDLDEALPYMLAVRLTDYGAEPSDTVMALAEQGHTRVRQLYGAVRQVSVDTPLQRLLPNCLR